MGNLFHAVPAPIWKTPFLERGQQPKLAMMTQRDFYELNLQLDIQFFKGIAIFMV